MIDEENQVNATTETTEVPAPGDSVDVTVDPSGSSSEAGASASSNQSEAGDMPITLGDVVIEDGVEGGTATPQMAAALAEKESEIQALKLQLEDRNSQFARMAADFDNFRKRTQREREEQEQKVKCDTLSKLLPVVDNFERARSQIKPQTDGENTIHKSYQSVYKQLVECFKSIGVTPMRAEGKEFDPTLHEAVMREATNEFPEGTVLEELQRGYMLGDRVLRHAYVKVAATPDVVVASEEGSEPQTEN